MACHPRIERSHLSARRFPPAIWLVTSNNPYLLYSHKEAEP